MKTWEYIISDLFRYNPVLANKNAKLGIVQKFNIIKYAFLSNNYCFKYLIYWRLSHMGGAVGHYARYTHRKLSTKYGIQIPLSVQMGYGFYIGHGVGIVVNGKTKFGNNVNISQFLSIGSNKGTPAIIGDNVYIGPNVCIIEDIIIGNNSIIGAGSVVTKNVEEGMTVAGNPARLIGPNKHPEFIHNKWKQTVE